MKKKLYLALPSVVAFIDSQNVVVQAEYRALAGKLEELGFLAYPQAEKVDPGLFAIRIRKCGNVRVFYVYDDGVRVYGIHAYEKKAQAIPEFEIQQARRVARKLREIWT